MKDMKEQIEGLTKVSQEVSLPALNIQRLRLKLIGDTSLISHKWSEKAKKQMRDKQMKKAKQAKEAKNPKKEFEESLYKLPNGKHAFPAIAFKAAAVNACSHVDGMTKVLARGSFHIPAELVEIKGKPVMREDMVTIGGIGTRTTDIRYRGEFKAWSCEIEIAYNANVVSVEQLVNLFNTAGFAIGIGEWRPQKNGNHGMFHVAKTGE